MSLPSTVGRPSKTISHNRGRGLPWSILLSAGIYSSVSPQLFQLWCFRPQFLLYSASFSSISVFILTDHTSSFRAPRLHPPGEDRHRPDVSSAHCCTPCSAQNPMLWQSCKTLLYYCWQQKQLFMG